MLILRDLIPTIENYVVIANTENVLYQGNADLDNMEGRMDLDVEVTSVYAGPANNIIIEVEG